MHFWYQAQLGLTYHLLRRYEEARLHFNRSLELEPEQAFSYMWNAQNVLVWTGDTRRCREIIGSAPARNDPRLKGVLFEAAYLERDFRGAISELSTLSDDQLGEYINRTTPIVLLRAFAYHRMNDHDRARACFESGRAIMEGLLNENPDDGSIYGPLALIYAGLGREEDALRAGRKGYELCRNDEMHLTEREWDLARLFLMLGDYDTAIDHVEHLLSVPSRISVTLLEIHPEIDPLRDDLRFKELISRYSKEGS